MHRFYADPAESSENSFFLSPEDTLHASKVLRMRPGGQAEIFFRGVRYLSRVERISDDLAVLQPCEVLPSTEPKLSVTLFQGLPKSDKLELIIQKTAELGVFSITPTEMNRSIVKIEDKKKKNKIERWQAISESAAKQSKRNIIPEIRNIVSFKEALKEASLYDLILVPFESEKGMESTKNALNEIKAGMDIAVFIA